MGEEHVATLPSLRDRLQKADQVGRGIGRRGLRQRTDPFPPTKPNGRSPAKRACDGLSISPASCHEAGHQAVVLGTHPPSRWQADLRPAPGTAMASKLTLNAHNLTALGAPQLAELLLELSRGDAAAKRRLRLALAAAQGVDDAAREVRKRLASIERATTVVDSRRRPALVADLEAQRQAILGPIAEGNPRLALDLLWRFLDLAEGVLDRCYDSRGTVWAVFTAAVEDLPAVVAAAAPEPMALAEQVAECVVANGYGQFDRLIPLLAEALGEQGLDRLKQDCLALGASPGHPALLAIADARGDVDDFIAQFQHNDLGWPPVASQVAQRLLAAGRAEEALTMLNRAATTARARWSPDWENRRIQVLEALDRHQEAQQCRWEAFERVLSISHLRDYLKRLPDFEDTEAEERALDAVEASPDALEALSFLIAWPALSRAAHYVIRHWDQWDGEAFEVLGPAAERLSGNHPLAAVLLLRSMVVFALSMGRRTRYRYAAEHLRTCHPQPVDRRPPTLREPGRLRAASAGGVRPQLQLLGSGRP